MTPTVGRIVLVTLDNGEVRAADVVRVWSDSVVNLTLKRDGDNDNDATFRGNAIPLNDWLTSVEGGGEPAPGRWHWPPRT